MIFILLIKSFILNKPLIFISFKLFRILLINQFFLFLKQSAAGEIIFEDHQTNNIITVHLFDDGVPETEKSFFVDLKNPTGGGWLKKCVVKVHT